MTLQEAHKQLLFQLYELYDDREAANIADLVIEHVTGQRKIDRILNKQMPVSLTQQEELTAYTQQLLLYKPVQYVLHEAWFAGMKLYVDENVLIPRPETEELVNWIVDCRLQIADCRLLDIGTGSGCIPIALKKRFSTWDVHALDISAGALGVAKKNAIEQGTEIAFHKADILNEAEWVRLPVFDMIVSNPPYIRNSEAAAMQNNVTRFEPHTSLFVPDEDVLLFHKKIAGFARLHLRENGLLFFEINESLGDEVCSLLSANGFIEVELKKDMQGKDRMVRGMKALP